MNLLQRFGLMWKASRFADLISMFYIGQAVPTPRDYAALSKHAYMNNVVAFRSIAAIATNIGAVKLGLYQQVGDELVEVEGAHPMKALLARPNPMMTLSTFLQYWVSFMMISGNNYTEAVGAGVGGAGPIKELWILRPDRMRVIPGLQMPMAYEYTVNGISRRVPVDQVSGGSPILHSKFFHPLDDWYGMSPLESAALAVDQHNAAGTWNLGLLQNGARPSGILSLEPSQHNPRAQLTPEQKQDVKNELDQKTGPNQAGRPWLLTGGLKWQDVSITPKEMDFLGNKNTSARDVALALGVPPQLLGIPGDNTYANYAEARQAFAEGTWVPLAELVAQELTLWLAPRFSANGRPLVIQVDKDEIDALAPKREAVWARVKGASWLTENEKRAATGYSPYDPDQENPADRILMGSGLTPIEDLVVAEEAVDPMEADPAAVADQTSDFGGDADEDPEDDLEETNAKGLEFKVVNLTGAGRERYRRRVERMREASARTMRKRLRVFFEMERDEILGSIGGLTEGQALSVAQSIIDGNRPQLSKILKASIRGAAKVFGQQVLRGLKSDGLLKELKVGEDVFEQTLSRWVETYVGTRISLITGTTKERLVKNTRTAMAQSLGEGLGGDVIAKSIRQTYDGFGKYRADRIARTEMVIASNQASLAAAQATGIQNLKKEWVSVRDDRTRTMPPDSADHLVMDGVTIGMNEKFRVPSVDGFDEMSAPADSNGPADQVINCRCTLAFSTGA